MSLITGIFDLVEQLWNNYTAARAAKLDGIVDWAGKTFYIVQVSQNIAAGATITVANISGSGYVLSAGFWADNGLAVVVDGFVVDGVDKYDQGFIPADKQFSFNGPIRFESSLLVQVKNTAGTIYGGGGYIAYVLD